MANWDKRFMNLAEHVSGWSKDRSAKVGCVIVGPHHEVRATGYNGFPRGSDDTVEDRHQRPLKYKWVEHSERNAVANAARCGTSLNGCTAYTPFFPCTDCGRLLAQSGIVKIVTLEPDWTHERWGSDFKVSLEILEESGVEIRWFPPSEMMHGPIYTVREDEVLQEILTQLANPSQDQTLTDVPHLKDRVRILLRYYPGADINLICKIWPVQKDAALRALHFFG